MTNQPQLFVREVERNGYNMFQIEAEGNGLRSIIAKLYPDEICEEHGTAGDYADLIARAVNSQQALVEACELALRLLDNWAPKTPRAQFVGIIKIKEALAAAKGVA